MAYAVLTAVAIAVQQINAVKKLPPRDVSSTNVAAKEDLRVAGNAPIFLAIKICSMIVT